MSIDNKDLGSLFTPEELMEIMNTEVLNYEVVELESRVDEELVDDFIVIAGYTEDEAYAAAEGVAKYDNLF